MMLTAIGVVLQIWIVVPCVWITQMHNEELRREAGAGGTKASDPQVT
jgi:hypothetical protein